jgi:sugar phosphate isomerase/epimerase
VGRNLLLRSQGNDSFLPSCGLLQSIFEQKGEDMTEADNSMRLASSFAQDEVRDRAERNQALSRRAFLKTAATAVAAVGGGRSLAWAGSGANGGPASKTTEKVVVGAHPWVYAATQPGYDITPVLDQIFADMSYAGMDTIELMHEPLRNADTVKRIEELSHKYKLPVLGTSWDGEMWDRSQHSAILKDAELVVARLAKLGGRTLGTSVGRAPQPKTPQQLDAQAELLRKIMALCKAHGVVLNLHNHTYEVENHEHDLKGTLARIPDVKLGPDLNWLVRAGVDPVDFIRRYGKRIVFLHLRDQKADGAWPEAMGEGNTDYVAIGRELHKINFSGDAVIELAHENGFKLTRPLRESLKISREYVRKTLGY